MVYCNVEPLSIIIADFSFLQGDNVTDPDHVVAMTNRMPS